MGLFRRGRVWWMGFVYGGRRVRRSTEVTDQKLAQKIYDKVKWEIVSGKWFERLPEENRTFREMMEKFQDEHISKKASARSYRSHSKTLISHFGDYVLKDITPKLISEYKTKRGSDGIKPATINRELATMKKAFNLAIREWEWVKENPVIRVSMEEVNNKRVRWLTDEEEKRLLEECPEWLKEMVIFALNTGMRKGEILFLTWKGVNLFNKTIVVFKSKNREM
jgi:integrase